MSSFTGLPFTTHQSRMPWLLWILAFLLAWAALLCQPTLGATPEYHLTIAMETVNITGKPVEAMTINGGIPGPTIEMTEGDTVTIHVHNTMDTDTSIHWHGILLPNPEDGVPYLTTPPIKAHTTHTFSFPVIQSGTYWYHSHTRLQEQRGLYGAILIHPKEGTADAYPTQSAVEFAESAQSSSSTPTSQPAQPRFHADGEEVLVLSDWTQENPKQVLKNLKRGLDWYGIKKKTKQSVVGAFQRDAAWASIKRSFKRMPPMDLSDVAYDAFLINGKPTSTSTTAQPGDTLRLRLVNGSASTYFYVNYGGGEMTVVAADGLPVEPVTHDRLLIAIAETYDVLVKVPESGKAEFRAWSQDGSGSASYWLGQGEPLPAPAIPKPNMYIMGHDPHAMIMDPNLDHKGHMDPMGFMSALGIGMMSHGSMDHGTHGSMGHSSMNSPGMDHSAMEHTTMDHHPHGHTPPHGPDQSMNPMAMDKPTNRPSLKARPFAPYHTLKAIEPTTLPKEGPTREYTFHLTGDMTRYIWTLNGKTLKESDLIKINRGENVRFTLINDTMMHHPMHLHGHFFRVVNEQGAYSPLKHTVDVPPMGQRVIEFAANESKDWFFHCHVLYHMKSGMSRIVSYEDYSPEQADTLQGKLFHDPWYSWGSVTGLSQMMEGNLTTSNTRNTLQANWEYNWRTEFDTELTYERYINRFVQVFGGANLYREADESFDAVGIVGIRYLLPFMINSTTWVDSDGDFRVSLEQEIPITQRLSVFGEVEYDTDTQFEWVAGLSYMINATVSIVGQYHSDFGAGGGLQIRF